MSSLFFPVCSTPTSPSYGTVSADGASVQFTCDTGYTMNGESFGFCTDDGTGWNIETPTCGELCLTELHDPSNLFNGKHIK